MEFVKYDLYWGQKVLSGNITKFLIAKNGYRINSSNMVHTDIR